MDTQFLSSLLAVLDEGSIAAAARREGVTASAVSQRVSALEAQLGVDLLRRAGRVMQATPECRALLPRMRQMVALERDLRATLRGATLAGRLRLGAVSTAMGDHAAGVLRQLRQAAPEVTLELVPGTSEALYEMMERDGLDAAVLVAPPFELPKSLAFFPVEDQPIGLLRGRDAVGDLPYLLYSRAAWGGALCWQALAQQDPTPEVLAEMDALEVMAQMVEDGVAQAVLPRWRGVSRYPGLAFTPLAGATRRIGLLVHQRDAEGAVVGLLKEALTP
ncbi:HTH-type transcriptional regulator TfdS [Tritonibacter multivorans]|uniref:HTH-type transcriptional regulator TfdS n=1 Tax=Tritonibacter multivorans TaxID=928856 RepID=A0A0P1G6I2_9RHOB|nr:LysR substrate-binding domain-containing protein [Tritonibacter multivorans]MDA7422786.1 LysR substrate-binding domain-containing protein [Tritonibacter multivorans]CUH77349.1 HTH-type transcriptional regulator TfdS [Tritonibacter multivorans]SFD59946.1 transcriptional regulator, LysR family [Tritonibacter multivorans]